MCLGMSCSSVLTNIAMRSGLYRHLDLLLTSLLSEMQSVGWARLERVRISSVGARPRVAAHARHFPSTKQRWNYSRRAGASSHSPKDHGLITPPHRDPLHRTNAFVPLMGFVA